MQPVTGRMLKDVTEGFVSNHSLRRSGTSRLFQAGIDRKLVKEYTGHRSYAVDQYQITSDAQRTKMSNIIQGNSISCEEAKGECSSKLELMLTDKTSGKSEMSCICTKNSVKTSETLKVADLISQIVNAKKGVKTTVRIEIDFEKE